MSKRYDCRDPQERIAGIEAAVTAARAGELIVLPTDTVYGLGAVGQDLIDEFWPGALTLVFRASPTLLWDLGDSKGTVALRMPLHSVALDVLKQTGPLAVS